MAVGCLSKATVMVVDVRNPIDILGGKGRVTNVLLTQLLTLPCESTALTLNAKEVFIGSPDIVNELTQLSHIKTREQQQIKSQ